MAREGAGSAAGHGRNESHFLAFLNGVGIVGVGVVDRDLVGGLHGCGHLRFEGSTQITYVNGTIFVSGWLQINLGNPGEVG